MPDIVIGALYHTADHFETFAVSMAAVIAIEASLYPLYQHISGCAPRMYRLVIVANQKLPELEPCI